MSENFMDIKIEDGVLRGQQKKSEGLTSIKYYAFKGIPFAKPPIGDLRFQAPQPNEPWEGIRNALEEGHQSIQISEMGGNSSLVGSEDCLYLNVYIPELPANKRSLKPVLFNIHGGGFALGSGGIQFNNPDYLIENDIVIVSPNYRLGALGFLSLQNDEISGNAGIKDQILALKWTQKNIKYFGGDPDNVTIMGISAGSASVEYILLSELSRGLFKQAICLSGSAHNPWAINMDPITFANKLANKIGYTGELQDVQALQDFFKSCSAKDIVNNQGNVLTEKEGKGIKLITKKPRDIYESGNFIQVPVIKTLTSNEGSLYYYMATNIDEELEKINENLDMLIPMNMNVSEDKKFDVSKKIMQYYFQGLPISKSNMESFIDLVSDLTFSIGIDETTNSIMKHSDDPIFIYFNSYEYSKGMMKTIISMIHPDVEIKGAPHGAEMDLIFKAYFPGLPPNDPTPGDKRKIQTLTKLLTTFVKTGNPNFEELDCPPWEPISKTNKQYLDFGSELKMVPGRSFEKRLEFWEDLYETYGYIY
uniref:Carboxylic ester hydrolase n=1 Tax=Clastoptera arizonana TaxID=38151 RepID=A0A1B6EDH4_9HEMI